MKRKSRLPDNAEACRLHDTIKRSVSKSAMLAQAEPAGSNGDAAKLLASIIPIVAERASNILAPAWPLRAMPIERSARRRGKRASAPASFLQMRQLRLTLGFPQSIGAFAI